MRACLAAPLVLALIAGAAPAFAQDDDGDAPSEMDGDLVDGPLDGEASDGSQTDDDEDAEANEGDPAVEEEEDAAEGDPGEDIVDSLGAAMGQLGQQLGPDAPQHTRIRWDPTWPRYRFDELVVTLGMGLVIGLEEILPTRGDPNWSDVSDLDLEVAAALGLDDPTARQAAADASAALVGALFLWPVAVDALLYAGVGEGAWDVAWQLSLISLEVITVNHALSVLVRLLSRREGPVGRFCREETGYDSDPLCRDQPPAQSFWASQVSNAFAGASLVCMHHDVLDLFGDEVSDGMACGTALAAAATTGVLQIMADRNWVTDVLAGAVVGSLTGTLIPWLLHYMGGGRPPLRGSDAPTFSFAPMSGEGVYGVSMNGRW